MTEKIEEVKAEEILQLPVVTVPSVDNWIQSAIDNKLDINVLERLFAMKKEYDAEEAKKAFDEAMSLFQSKCPTIKKTKRGGATKDGEVVYFYAPIEDIEAQTKELRAECGFSYLIKTEFPENKVKAICQVRHVKGHSEGSEVLMPLLVKTGVMSEAQVVAGTITFAKRYAFCDAFGIMTMDDDSDGMTPDYAMEKLESILPLIPEDSQRYLKKLASSIERKSTFDKWVDEELPTQQQFDKMSELCKPLNQQLQAKYWFDFIRQNQKTADSFLQKFETALNKSKKE